MLNNRTIPIRSGLLCLAVVAIFAGWFVSWSAAQQVPDAAAGKPADQPGAAAPVATGAPGAPGAQGAPGAPVEEPPTEAERAIDLAILKLAKLESVSAKVEQDVEMLNQKFKITGVYMKAPHTRVYSLLELSDGLPDSKGKFLQVCDGETLWDYELVLDQPFYRRWTIKPILERLNSPDLDSESRTRAMTSLGIAGPEALLIGLRKSIRFDIQEATVLNGRKVVKFHGLWKSRQGLNFNSSPVNAMGVLPPYIPMDATLYLGLDDSWPYHLILEGRATSNLLDTRRVGPDGRPVGSRASIEKIPRSKIILTYSDVKLNAPIRNDEFVFQAPPNATVSDDTDTLVKNLDHALEVAAQKKKSDAATKDGEMLTQPIDVPAPGVPKGDSKPPE
jgi:outer membrane lipoprotein-sorting protein